MKSNEPIGHLHDDLTALAGRVQMSLIDGHQTVWADDNGKVFASSADSQQTVPTHWIAGTFGMGQPLSDIVDDLRALLRERSKDWIIE